MKAQLPLFFATALAFAACSKSGNTSDVMFNVGETSQQGWYTNYLNAGSDPDAATATTLDGLKKGYRTNAYQVIPWNKPARAADTDQIQVSSKSDDAGLDSDLFLLDAYGRVVRASASEGSVESITGLKVKDVTWPLQVFIGAYGPSGKVSRVVVYVTIVGTEQPASSLTTNLSLMQNLCSRASGSFLSHGDTSRCQCNGNVITYDRFSTDMMASGTPSESKFFAACTSATNPDASLITQLNGLCKRAGGDFLSAGSDSRCTCQGNVFTLARLKSDFMVGSVVDDSKFVSQCLGLSGTPENDFRGACLANGSSGSVLSTTNGQLSCDCRGWTLLFSGYKMSYLDKGRTADDYRNDCKAALH